MSNHRPISSSEPILLKSSNPIDTVPPTWKRIILDRKLSCPKVDQKQKEGSEKTSKVASNTIAQTMRPNEDDCWAKEMVLNQLKTDKSLSKERLSRTESLDEDALCNSRRRSILERKESLDEIFETDEELLFIEKGLTPEIERKTSEKKV